MANLLISHNFKTMKCPVVSGTFRTLAADPLDLVGCGVWPQRPVLQPVDVDGTGIWGTSVFGLFVVFLAPFLCSF